MVDALTAFNLVKRGIKKRDKFNLAKDKWDNP